MREKIFLAEHYQKKIESSGYIIIPAIDDDLFKDIVQLFNDFGYLDSGFKDKFRTSLFNNTPEERINLTERSAAITKELVDKLFIDYKLLFADLFEKLPHGIETPIHQHPTFVDESKYVVYSIWIPLLDTDINSGTFTLVEGSHKIDAGIRTRQNSSIEKLKALDLKFLEPKNVKKGEVIIFDDRLIHGALPNYSEKIRSALHLVLVPKEAETFYYTSSIIDNKAILNEYSTEDHFFDKVNHNQEPVFQKTLRSFEYIPKIFTENILIQELREKNPNIQYPYRDTLFKVTFWKLRCLFLKYRSLSRVKFGV